MEKGHEEIPNKITFFSRVLFLLTERPIHLEFREIWYVFRFEFKRIILSLKFFIALSLVLLPAVIFLNSISSDYEALILDMGIVKFQKFCASGFTIIGQFLLQLIGLMLVLDGFGKSANDSMNRYFALPIRKANIFRGHLIAIISGVIITGILGIVIFNLILWIWTGISITFILMAKAFLLTLVGALLAIMITLLFIMIANFFNFSSSIAIIPTLFLFYIIPFLVNFVTQFVYSIPKAYEWTFMYHLAVITDFWIKPENGLQTILDWKAKRRAWLIISLIAQQSEFYSLLIFTNSEK
ncbi:MAG: hypothetical protein JXA54_01290 [Candidatus Heimdallarchaeota archaeon]|nr:hypothetical protein [Candidatus Heimdallarchaeota archaeon]